jgi:hypothetical protein
MTDGEIVYIPGEDEAGHSCRPPLPSFALQGSVWLCGCGKAWIKTEWNYISDSWRRPHWWEFHVRDVSKKGLKKRRLREAEEQFKQAEEVVKSFSEAQARRDSRS